MMDVVWMCLLGFMVFVVLVIMANEGDDADGSCR